MTVAVNDTNGHVPWNEKLLQPFGDDEIGTRPQVWCGECRKSIRNGQKACDNAQHKASKCTVCSQNITSAHLHLFYVGHADLTHRLLDADPRWTWEPMARDIDPDVIQAAIASGSPEIVKLIIDASPPKIEQFEVKDNTGKVHIERGMWMRLILHDEDGNEVVMIGFGDAKGKDWTAAPGDVIKEIIGDGLRNAGMRRGAALDLWRKQDREQARKERQAANPDDPRAGAAARAALFDDDAPAIGAGTPPPEPPDKDAQKAIQDAWDIVQAEKDPLVALDQVRADIADPARRIRGRLAEKVHPPWSKDPAERIALSNALRHVKNVLEQRQDTQAAKAGSEA